MSGFGYNLMRGATAFDTILDQQLRVAHAPRRTDPRASLHGVATAYGFFFAESSLDASRSLDLDSVPVASDPLPAALESRWTSDTAVLGASKLGVRSRPPRPSAIPASREGRTLTLLERRALDELIGSGARLTRDFTLPELRSSFRALALEYHPDRHASRTSEVADLSARFARIVDAYRVLVDAAGRC